MIVLDASAAIEWLLQLPQAELVEPHLRPHWGRIHVPHLFAIEVTQVVRRYVSRGEVTSRRGEAALADLAALDAVRHPHEPLLPLIWQLRENFTAYDAAYVALAIALDAPLVTFDGRIAAAPHGADVHVLGARTA